MLEARHYFQETNFFSLMQTKQKLRTCYLALAVHVTMVSTLILLIPFRKALILDWVCAEDRTTMFICEDGRLRCGSFQHDDEVVNWKFDCGGRSGVHKNVHFLYPDFNYAMSAAIAQQTRSWSWVGHKTDQRINKTVWWELSWSKVFVPWEHFFPFFSL